MPDIQYDETTGEPYLPITHLGLRLTPYRRTEDDIAAMVRRPRGQRQPVRCLVSRTVMSSQEDAQQRESTD